ncbi:MAG: hypothetical protein GX600_09845 [Dehalococcoidia bacterium]|nr:hypothetical protein [Dehalococcoidia bacterium]
MPDGFRRNALCEAGEAIGDLGERLLRKRCGKNHDVEEALERWLRVFAAPVIPPPGVASQDSEHGVTIEGVYRVMRTGQEDSDG